MEIQFLINEQSVNAMTWEEYEAFERSQEGDTKLYRLRPILARFVVDDKDNPVEHEIAMRLLGKVPMAKIKEVISLFVETMKNGTVPKVSENLSPSHLELERVG